MQTSNRLLDDLAKVANSAVSTLAGVKDEAETLFRQRLERFLADADLVPRDEFEAVKAVAQKAREEQEKLEERVKALEVQLAQALGAKAASKKPAAKKAAAKNTASGKTASARTSGTASKTAKQTGGAKSA